MKKIFALFFVIVVVCSCLFVPFASADSVTGGSETVESPYRFTFTLPTVLGTLLSTTEFYTSNENQYSIINNLSFILEQDMDTSELSLSSTFNDSIGFSLPYCLPYSDTSTWQYRSFFALYPIGGFYSSSSTFSNSVFLTNNSQDIYIKVRSFYSDRDTTNFTSDSFLSFSVFHTVDFTLADLSRREVFFDSDINGIVVRYYSLNNHYLQFTFFNYNYLESFNTYWLERYSVVSDLDSLYNLGANTLYYITSITGDDNYIIGYNDGLVAGKSIGYDDGFSVGLNQGDTIGYNRGYSEGITNANNYSFVGLISAVFDAPIKAFRGLLDFNLLGVDMAQFALSLFSLSLIIVVIRFMLAR